MKSTSEIIDKYFDRLKKADPSLGEIIDYARGDLKSQLKDFVPRDEKKKGIKPGSISIIPLIESALAVEKAFQLASERTDPERLFTMAFGAADFTLDMGIELTKTGKIRRKFILEKYKDLYDALYDEGVSEKKVEAFFQYQDGQTTTVETTIDFFTMDEVA